jgi:hypothetical protein
MYFYRGTKLFAVRHGPWKAHFLTQAAYGGKDGPTEQDPPLLYHLGRDPGEKTDVAKDNPEVVKQLKALTAKHKEGVKPGEPQLEKRLPPEKKVTRPRRIKPLGFPSVKTAHPTRIPDAHPRPHEAGEGI